MAKRGPRKHIGTGRPTVMTPEVLSKLEQAFSVGAPDRDACVYAGIGEASLYDYCKKYPAFSERKEMLKEKLVLVARDSLAKGVKNDPKLAMDFLKTKRKDEFSTRSEHQHSGVKKFVMEFTDEPDAK